MKKRLLFLTLAIILIIAGVNVVVRGRYISDKVRDRIVESAREKLRLDVGMDRLVFNVFPAYIDIYSPSVGGWDEQRPERRAHAESVRVYFSLPALFSNTLYISRVQVIAPNAIIEKRLDGSYNFEDVLGRLDSMSGEGKPPAEAETDEEGLDVELREVVLHDMALAYTDPSAGIAVSVGDGGLDLRFEDDGRIWTSYNLQDVVAVQAGRNPFHISAKGETTLSGKGADIKGLNVRAENTRVRVDGSVVYGDGDPDLDLKVDAKADLGLLQTLGVWPDGPDGLAGIKGKVKGRYPQLNGGGDISIKDASYAGVSLDSLKADFTFDAGRLRVEGISADLMDGEVAGRLTALFDKNGLKHVSEWTFRDVMTGRLTEPDPDLNFVPWQKLSGNLSLRGDNLDPSTFAGSGRLVVDKYEEPHESPGEWYELAIIKKVDMKFDIKDDTFMITRGSARAYHTWTEFTGTMGFDLRLDLALTGGSDDAGEIGYIIGYDNIDGRIDAAGTVTGTLLNPTIRGNSTIKDGYAAGISFPNSHGEVVLEDWKLMFNDYVIQQEYGEFELDGKITFQGENADFSHPYFDAVLQVRQARARPIITIFYEDIPVDLVADGVIEFHGNTKDFTGSADLSVGEGAVYGQKVDKGSVRAVLSPDDISFPEVIGVRERDIVTASGRIGFDGTFEGRAASARFDIQNMDLLRELGVPVRGAASAVIEGSGPFSDPVITANVKPYSLFLKDVDLGGGSIEAVIKDDMLAGTALLMEGKVSFEADMALSSPHGWQAKMSFEGGRFEPFLRMAYAGLPEEISLVSTGSVNASGSMDGTDNETVSVEFSDVNATVMGRTMKNVGQVSFSYASGVAEIGSLKFEGEDMHFEATGGARSLHELSVGVKAGLDASILKHFLEDNLEYADGRMEVSASVEGDVSDPAVSGNMSVRGGAVRFAGLPQRFDDIDADVTFEGGMFTLSSLTAAFGGGRLEASGKGGFADWKVDNFTFDVDADGVRIKFPGELNNVVDAELYVEGAGTKRVVGGEIEIVKSRYTERIEWKSWLTLFASRRKEILEADYGALGDVALNLHISADDTIQVDNNLAKIPVRSDLYVRGTVSSPALIGRLEANSGQVFLRNNSFRLQNAVVEFADPTAINPLIDLQAETQVREYLINMTLSGTMEKLDVSLSSDPPLDDRDILALLTLGRTAEDVAGQEGIISTGEAASFVTGQLQDAVEERVMRLTGFDRFQIDPYTTSTGASTGPRLTLGKRLFSDRLYITYSSNLGTSEDQFIRLEYIFNRNLSLVGERDELGRFGGDLKLRMEFR